MQALRKESLFGSWNLLHLSRSFKLSFTRVAKIGIETALLAIMPSFLRSLSMALAFRGLTVALTVVFWRDFVTSTGIDV